MKIVFLMDDTEKIQKLNRLKEQHTLSIVQDFDDIDIFCDLLILDYTKVISKKIMPYLISQYSPVNFMIVCGVHSDKSYELSKMNRFLGFIDKNWQPVVIETAIENALRFIDCQSLTPTDSKDHSRSLADELYPCDPNTSGIVYYDSKGNVLNFNTAAEKMLETKIQAVQGQPVANAPWQLINENGQEITWPMHPVYQAIESKKMVLNKTIGVYSPNQENYRWLQMSSIPIYNDKHEVNVVYSHLKDITKEREYEERSKVMAMALEFSPLAILITDSEGNILSANQSFEEISGYPESELLGKNPRILKSDQSETDYENLWQTIKSGKVWTGEFVNVNANGVLYQEDAVIAPVINEHGIITNFVAMKEDVTALRRVKSELEETLQKMEELVAKRTASLKATQNMTLEALAKLAEFRDNETGNHIQRTKAFVKLLIEQLPENNAYSEDEYRQMWQSAPLHDIGKVAISDLILLKKGPLTQSEFEKMKKHTLYGYQALIDSSEKQPYLKFAKEITLGHHERWDGSGYPFGLKGLEIPLSARLMAIADVYDAMRSKRPYKSCIPHTIVVREIQLQSGKHFDPELVDIFLKIHEKFDTIYQKMIDK